MKYLIILPVVDEETTAGCLYTIDKDIAQNICIVDNSGTNFASKYKVGEIVPQSENVGVSRSWNIGVRKVLESDLDYLIILSATMRFSAGMRDFIKHLELNLNVWGLETQHGWHCIALSRKTLETIGYFDENFYPGYYEDSDYIRRMEVAGFHNPMSKTNRIPKVDILAGFEGNAHAIRKAKINVNMEACRQYFIDKWGYEPRYDAQQWRDLLYKWPFNNPKNDLKYWENRSIEELKIKYNLLNDSK